MADDRPADLVDHVSTGFAAWGNWIRDHSIPVFTDAAARTAGIPSPVRGMMCFMLDTGKLLWYYGATTGWQPPWGDPWGQMDISSGTAAAGTSSGTTETSILASDSFTVPAANRNYEVLASCSPFPTVTTDLFTMRLRLDSTAGAELVAHRMTWTTVGQGNCTLTGALEAPTAAAHTIQVTGQRILGTGTVTHLGGIKWSIIVNDIGPATTAPPAS